MILERIARDEATVGREITVNYMPDGESGAGGVVTARDETAITIVGGTAKVERVIPWAEVHHLTVEVPYPAEDCLEYDPDECEGPVELRWPGSGHASWPRCEFHGDRRVERAEDSIERWADCVLPPSWFDPSAIGESWDGE